MTVDPTAQLHAAMPYTALLGASTVAAAAAEVRLRLDWARRAAPRAACCTAAR